MTINSHSFYEIQVKTIDGQMSSLNSYRGKTLLIVNVASRCGFTKQYAELEELYQCYQQKDFVILAFPCNQFAQQESGTEQEIKHFCETTFNISFPLFAKIQVNGPEAHPLYVFLKHEQPGILGSEKIKWNFTKFLVTANGAVVKRFAPVTTPKKIASYIEKIIN